MKAQSSFLLFPLSQATSSSSSFQPRSFSWSSAFAPNSLTLLLFDRFVFFQHVNDVTSTLTSTAWHSPALQMINPQPQPKGHRLTYSFIQLFLPLVWDEKERVGISRNQMGKPPPHQPPSKDFPSSGHDKSFTWLSGVRRGILEIPLALGRAENVIAPNKDSREAPKVTMALVKACLLNSYSLFFHQGVAPARHIRGRVGLQV